MGDLERFTHAGAIAVWMHNLAFYSSIDFDGFDEDWFWGKFQLFSKRYAIPQYHTVFAEYLEQSL